MLAARPLRAPARGLTSVMSADYGVFWDFGAQLRVAKHQQHVEQLFFCAIFGGGGGGGSGLAFYIA